MAMSITCECGKRLAVREDMAGKRVKCPACQSVVDVPEGDEERPAGQTRAGNGNGGKKSSKGLWIGAGVGVLMLGFCCVCSGGIGAWFFLFRGPSGMEAKIVGKWVPDVEPGKKGTAKNPEDLLKLAFGGDIEFKADHTVIDRTPMTPITQGKWKTVATKGDVITVELSQAIFSQKLDIKVVDNDHLKITPADSKTEFAFKRAP